MMKHTRIFDHALDAFALSVAGNDPVKTIEAFTASLRGQQAALHDSTDDFKIALRAAAPALIRVMLWGRRCRLWRWPMGQIGQPIEEVRTRAGVSVVHYLFGRRSFRNAKTEIRQNVALTRKRLARRAAAQRRERIMLRRFLMSGLDARLPKPEGFNAARDRLHLLECEHG